MKKKFLIMFICLFLITPVDLFAIKDGYMGNLPPQVHLNFSVEPLPRKIDLVIDAPMMGLSWSETKQLVNQELVPMLQSEGIDYKITYMDTLLKPRLLIASETVVHPLGGVYRTGSGFEGRQVNNLGSAKIIDAANDYLLDSQGYVHYHSSYSYSRIYHTDYIKLVESNRNTFGISSTGKAYYLNSNSSPYELTDVSDVVHIAGDRWSYLAVTSSGEVYGRGYGPFDPNYTNNSSKAKKIEGLSNIVQVGTDMSAGYAIDKDGNLYSWGSGRLGREGDSQITKINHEERFVKIIISQCRGCSDTTNYVLSSSGNVYQIGTDDLHLVNRNVMDKAHGITVYKDGTVNSGFRASYPTHGIFAGSYRGGTFSTYISDIRIWGSRDTSSYDPKLPDGEYYKDVYLYDYSYNELGGVILTESGNLYAWGRSQFGRYIEGTHLIQGISQVEQLAIGESNVMYAVTRNGNVYIKMGLSYSSGQYGTNADPPYDWAPVQVSNIAKIVMNGDLTLPSYSTGRKGFVIALDRNGDLWGWGHQHRALLDAPADERGIVTPSKLSLPFKVQDVVINRGVVAALDTDGNVWTWGEPNNYTELLGHGDPAKRSTPTRVPDLPKVKALGQYGAPDQGFFLVIGADNRIYGWGRNSYKLIAPDSTSSYFPTPVRNNLISGVSDVAIGENLVLVLTSSGGVFSWGYNSGYNRTGHGNSTTRSVEKPAIVSPENFPKASLQGREKRVYEILQDLSWRPDAERYYIHLADSVQHEFAEGYRFQQVLLSLLNDQIRYVGLSEQKDSLQRMRDLVASNLGRGKVIAWDRDRPAQMMRQIGQYVIKKLSMDVFFHIGTTVHDDLAEVKKVLETNLIPQVEQFGIELNIHFTDGHRIPENRLYYRNNQGHIVQYDPYTNTRRTIIPEDVKNVNIHFSGDLFFQRDGTSNIYRYDTDRHQESLYATLPHPPGEIGTVVVDDRGDIWYFHYKNWEDDKLIRYSPKTDQATVMFTAAYLTIRGVGALGDVIYGYGEYTSSGYSFRLVSPYSVTYPSIRDVIQGEDGCTYYIAYDGFMSFNIESSCKDVYLSPGRFARKIFNGDKGMLFTNYSGSSPGEEYIEVRLAPGLGWQRIDYGREVVTTTPDGRVYYIKYYSDDHLYWYNWRTGERGSLPAGAVNIEQLIPYEFINVKERFISKTSVHEELTNAVWRPDTDAYYVYLHDHTISGLASIEDELRDKRVTFIGLGTNTNKHQIDSFTEQLGHGTYIDNTNLNAAISELAAYLISQAGLPKYDENKETVILEYMEDQGIYQSGKLVFEDNYEDIENDPKVKERWMFRHDPDYYEQPLGRLAEHDQTLQKPITTLHYTGKYEVIYEAGDRPKNDPRFTEYERWSNTARLDIYAHRRPVAEFLIDVEPLEDGFYSLTIEDMSYDPDRISQSNRGIVEWQWRWKKDTDISWTMGHPPSTVHERDTYLISLSVRDEDGAWSDEKVVPLMASAHNNPPVALFTITSPIINDQEFTIDDQSYDPDGDPISDRHWKVTKDGLSIYDDTIQPTAAKLRAQASASSLSPYGSYRITLTVRDQPSHGTALWSEPYTQVLEIIENKPPVPGFHWSPATVYQGESVQLRHDVNDPEKETLRVRYQVTAPNGSVSYYPSSTSWYTVPAANYNSHAFSINDLQGGNYIILQTVQDAYSTRTLTRTMYVIPNRPPVADFTWTPATIWEGDTVQFLNQSFDPDDDPLTYQWKILYPDGHQYTTGSKDVQLRLTVVGTYTVQLIVSDGLMTAQKTETLQVRALTLEADVQHTDLWFEYHRSVGHETKHHPKDYYSGERFVLSAATSPAPVQYVRATLMATSRSDEELHVTTTLDELSASIYAGELYDERFSSLTDGIANGIHSIRFRVRYVNGTEKVTDVPIRIIGHVLDTVGVHRRR